MKVIQMVGLSIAIVLGGAMLSRLATSDFSTASDVPIAVIPDKSTVLAAAKPALIAQQTGTVELAVAPETNPPEDIPDTQVFINYRSANGGYQVEVPEGWARVTNGANVGFTDRFDGVQVMLSSQASPLTANTVMPVVDAIKNNGRAVTIGEIKDVKLSNSSAVQVKYTSNSEPNSVTGKQIRLENEAYLFFRSGKMAMLKLWAPQGADNVDQWQRISQSFRWL